jgi:phenylacetate-CoA ligase
MLYLLARYLDQAESRPHGALRAIFTTAELLYDFQHAAIQSAFGCPVSAEYALPEVGLVANECPEGSLHIFAEGMYLEILNANSEGTGEIVISGLDSFAFPMIRYRTGEFGSCEPEPCPCGRALPRLKVEGVMTDFLVTPRGRTLNSHSVIALLNTVPGIREFKVIQEAWDRVEVQIVPERPFSPGHHAALIGQFRLLLGNEVRVSLRPLTAIPRNSSGTIRYVESRVAEQYFRQLNRVADGHMNSANFM